jgi:5'/3'-nucleotidase SurE
LDWRHRESWGARESIKSRVAEIIDMLRPELKPDKFFSVNMPYDPEGAKIVRVHRMQRERYDTRVVRRMDPEGRPYYWITGVPKRPEKGTDVHEVIVEGNISITEISLSLFVK